jgi:hypothetical protein
MDAGERSREGRALLKMAAVASAVAIVVVMQIYILLQVVPQVQVQSELNRLRSSCEMVAYRRSSVSDATLEFQKCGYQVTAESKVENGRAGTELWVRGGDASIWKPACSAVLFFVDGEPTEWMVYSYGAAL